MFQTRNDLLPAVGTVAAQVRVPAAVLCGVYMDLSGFLPLTKAMESEELMAVWRYCGPGMDTVQLGYLSYNMFLSLISRGQ